jgi:hypothetical protein
MKYRVEWLGTLMMDDAIMTKAKYEKDVVRAAVRLASGQSCVNDV